MSKTKKEVVDLSAITAAQRKKIDRILHPHDTPFNLRTHKSYLDAWNAAAEARGESLTDWVERHLNTAAEAEGVK